MMMTNYVLVANAGEACLYTIDNLHTGKLEFLEKFEHPESRQKWSDIVSDKRGRYQTDHATRCSYEDKFDPKDLEVESFARELFDRLKSLEPDYESLVIIAPPQFQGVLRKVIGDSLPNTTDITKDYTQLSSDELIERIREHLFE
jgi:protein required for attachment to host cells